MKTGTTAKRVSSALLLSLALGSNGVRAQSIPSESTRSTAVPKPLSGITEPGSAGNEHPFLFRTVHTASQGKWLAPYHHAETTPRAIPSPLDNPLVAKFMKTYTTQGGKDWLETVMARSAPWRDHISGRLRYFGAPDELLYLPIVESSYSPSVLSKSGAAGLWQFMKNSIGGYDMKIDDWRDDRRDFMKSTDAAILKLMGNYRELGSWELALAAYNCGLGKVKGAIKKSGIKDYWELSEKKLLPAETIAYVPKFLAIAEILSRSGAYGVDPHWEQGTVWERLPLDKPLDVTMLADRIGLPRAILKTGNPELRYDVTPPGAYHLKIPVEFAEKAKAALADTANALLRFHLYAIKQGDTLSALAKHYGTPVSMILEYNPGTKPTALLPGKKLVIPALKDSGEYRGTPKKEVPPDTRAYASNWTVKKGDTLWSISLAVDAVPENLAQANGIGVDSILREGMTLKVPIFR